MSAAVDLHPQIASIMEVLANAAVAEICKVVDDGYAVVQLEVSRGQKENENLRRKIKLLELQVARYRAERAKGAEGAFGCRFPGVRLLNRQSKSPLAADPSLHGRNRFLNRGPGSQQCVQKSRPVNLDQDPDQEVVTTTKTESAEPKEEGELLIIKVEGAMETAGSGDEATPDIGIGTDVTRLPADSKDGGDGGWPARCSSVTEGQGRLESSSSPQSPEERRHEVQGDTPEKRGPPHALLDWRGSGKAEDVQQPSCSAYAREATAGNSSLSHARTNVASSGFPAVPSSGRGGTDGAEEVSHYQPLLCVQIIEPPSEGMYEGNRISMGTVDSQYQRTQHSGSEVGSHPQAPGPVQTQQQPPPPPCLPHACTFCSRRYAHKCQLLIHERVHTGEKPYQCNQCGKSFGQLCSLKRHLKVHTGERPFPCLHCGKQFSNSTNLRVHQSVHTGEKRFHCSKCGKNFSFLSNLIRHQALHSAR